MKPAFVVETAQIEDQSLFLDAADHRNRKPTKRRGQSDKRAAAVRAPCAGGWPSPRSVSSLTAMRRNRSGWHIQRPSTVNAPSIFSPTIGSTRLRQRFNILLRPGE